METKLVLENLQRYTKELEEQHPNETAYWHLQKLRNEIERVKNIAYEPVLPAVDDKIEQWVCDEFKITGLDYDEDIRTQYGYLPEYFRRFAKWLLNNGR